jgi:RNA polymerase sigma factor (sigma-70 family)
MKYLDDHVYIEKVLAGNVQAYALLVNKHKTMAFTVALRILRNREDAEEVSQDAFLKAYHALKDFKGESKFSTWLYRIIYTTSINRMRKNKPRNETIDEHSDSDIAFAFPEEELKSLRTKERNLYVKEAIESLEEDEAVLVTLFYIEDLPSSALCDITGLTDANVRVKLFRARKKMQLFLQQRLNHEVKEIL